MYNISNNNNFRNYKDGIKKFIGYNINNIYLVFIFDKETQEEIMVLEIVQLNIV